MPGLLRIYAVLYIVVFLHEAGHAVVCFLLDTPVQEIIVGLGPQLNLGVLSLGLLPVGGYVTGIFELEAVGIFLLFFLAGPVVNIATGAACHFYITKKGASDLIRDIRDYSFGVGVFNLLPLPFLDGGRALATVFYIPEMFTYIVIAVVAMWLLICAVFAIFDFVQEKLLDYKYYQKNKQFKGVT